MPAPAADGVHQDVDRAEMIDDMGHRRLCRVVVGHVGEHRHGLATQALHTLDGGVQARRCPPHDRDPRAGRGQRLSQRRSDPATTAGDERDAAGQAEDVEAGRPLPAHAGRTSGSGSIASRTAPTRSWYERMKPRRVRTVAPYVSNSGIERPPGS